MEEIKAKLKKLEIDDHTNDKNEDEEGFCIDEDGSDSDDDDDVCVLQ